MPGGEYEGPFAGNFGPIRERLVRDGRVTSGLPYGACQSHECALKLPFAELRLHAQRRRLLGSNYVGLWHNPDLQHPLELGPIMATLPTFGPECLVIVAFQTWRRGVAKVGT